MQSNRLKNKPELSILEPQAEWAFEAIGTQWWIGLYETVDDTKLTRLKKQISQRIEQFDQIYSRFRADSLVTKMSQQAGTYELPEDARPLLETYRKLYDLTGGAVTPLIGQVLSDAGYDATYSLKPGKTVAPPAWDEVLDYQSLQLTLKQPALLDFGAAGKGYLVDIVSELLVAQGIKSFCVDAGGDMRCEGLKQSLRVGLEHPSDPDMAIGVAEIKQGALCGSAGNRRTWAQYHHIIDPFTQTSPLHIQAVWVAAADALTADALTTALYFVEPRKLVKSFNFSCLVVYANGTMYCSPNFPAELFSEENDRA
jgi:thiamine biosynthesis lipoprotein